MEEDNNTNNTHRSSSSIQDAQGHWYSQLTSPDHALPMSATTTSTTILTTPTTNEQEQTEKETTSTEVIMISTDDDDNDNNDNRSQQSTVTIVSRRLSEEWLPPAASTPLDIRPNIPRSQEDDENELFTNIEQLIRAFVQQPNRRYPLTRVIEWTTGDQPRMEYIVVVVINRPTIIL